MDLFLCDASAPGMDGDVYHVPYSEAVQGMRHGYEIHGKTHLGTEWSHGVEWTRNPNHPPDPRCPECHAPKSPPPRAKEQRVHVPSERLERYRRMMALFRAVDRIGNQRSNRGDYAGANAAWTRADRIRTEAQKMRVPGRNGT